MPDRWPTFPAFHRSTRRPRFSLMASGSFVSCFPDLHISRSSGDPNGVPTAGIFGPSDFLELRLPIWIVVKRPDDCAIASSLTSDGIERVIVHTALSGPAAVPIQLFGKSGEVNDLRGICWHFDITFFGSKPELVCSRTGVLCFPHLDKIPCIWVCRCPRRSRCQHRDRDE